MSQLDSTAFIRIFSQELEEIVGRDKEHASITSHIIKDDNLISERLTHRSPDMGGAYFDHLVSLRALLLLLSQEDMRFKRKSVNFHLHTLFSRKDRVSCIAIDISENIETFDYSSYYKNITFKNGRAKIKFYDKFIKE